jgi:hypothetical protein
MRIKPIKRVQMRRKASPIRRGDGKRLVFATAGVIATLLLLFATADRLNVIFPAAAPNEAAMQAQIEAQAKEAKEAKEEEQARRVGSIVIASRSRLCEEFIFDNFTGRFLSEEHVDCEARLVQATSGEASAAKTARLRGMLNSFRK